MKKVICTAVIFCQPINSLQLVCVLLLTAIAKDTELVSALLHVVILQLTACQVFLERERR